MPELPEVETIKKGLARKIIGKKIIGLDVDIPKAFQGKEEDVIDAIVVDIERRAKTLRIKLNNEKYLLFHLKMTGQLIYIDHNKRIAGGHPSHDWHDQLPNKHTRIVFTFDDDTTLFFNDLRKFGWCKVLTRKELDEIDKLYGPEPFSKEFTAAYLEKRAESIAKKTVKQFIMDQQVIAGVGNIYADEALFLAGIHPLSKARALTFTDWERLVTEIKNVLEMGIEFGGTTDSDYVDAEGNKGGMQYHLNVYHRTGEPCPNECGGKIEKIKIGGRGTYFCKSCQKEL